MINFIILLRKYTNRILGNYWLFLGKIVRKFLKKNILIKHSIKKIGPYGPFKMNPEHLFSNLEEWGHGHNNGFVHYVEESKKKKCILDIGAHVGFTVLPVSKYSLNNQANIFAFEPSSENFKALNRNISLNNLKNIITENCVVGSCEADKVFFYETNDISATSSIINDSSRRFIRNEKKQTSIDNYCKVKKIKPDLIKIDVEGSEIEVLKGAKETMLNCKPLIFLSVHPQEIRKLGYSQIDLLDIFKEVNYEITNIDGSQVNRFEYIEYILKPIS